MHNFDTKLMTISLEKANETQLDTMQAAMAFASENAETICKNAGYPDSAADPARRFLKEMGRQLASATETLRGLPKGNYETIAQNIYCDRLTGGGEISDSRES